MGLFRKTMSLSTAGVVDWRDKSERAAAAERSKKNAYKERTAMDREMKDAEVVVSRGELIEIGGSFRLPDVIAEGGANLVEVGTTNRTTIADYAAAISPSTRLLLTSHPSNFRIEGFTAKPSLKDIAQLAAANDIVSLHDLGSGALVDLESRTGLSEPTVMESLSAGVDLVAFSGDKLLGGPQTGIIVGRRDLVQAMKRYPLLRALRIDKLSLAGLAATLRLYQAPHDPWMEVPVLRMLAATAPEIRIRAKELQAALATSPAIAAHITDDESFAGGGAMPMHPLETATLRLDIDGLRAQDLATRLRRGNPAVVARINGDHVVIDLRTVLPADMARLAAAILRAAA